MKPYGVTLPIGLLVFVWGAGVAIAQPTTSRLEIGVQVSSLRLSDFESTTAGIGGRFSFDVAKWAALEAAADFFPNDDALLSSSTLTPDLRVACERKRAEAFFGVKLGRRSDTFGAFAKVRPGFTRLSDNGVECVGDVGRIPLLSVRITKSRRPSCHA
jgi:hypothetical protein